MEDLIQQLREHMAQLSANSTAQINQLTNQTAAQMAELVATNTQLLQKITQLEATQAAYPPPPTVTVAEYADIEPNYTSGNDIQLDAFKVIHEFNGDKKVYRSWRTQVQKMMKQIENFRTTPKYAAALAIIRAKITGPASDILINNNTAHHIDAIIDRLDFSYADQRPLYVIEAEMTSIKQNSKSLQEFYDAINQSLNMVLTKITMSYKEPAEQKALIAETQTKAIRTFMTGLNSTLIRTTLYGNVPNSLSKAFAIAQTVQFDNQHMQLENKTIEQQKNAKRANQMNPNFTKYQAPQQYPMQKPVQNFVPPAKALQQPSAPMEVDSSRHYVQKTQHAANGFQQFKRQHEPSFQNATKSPTSFQHLNKAQRINHVDENDDICSVSENSMDNNCDTEDIEGLSTVSNEESIFLEG